METWKDRKRWADQFTPYIKGLLGQVFIREASVEEDRRENTDLMFDILGRRLAVRVRRIEERVGYNRRNEWTIRLTQGVGNESELTRLIAGWGDYFLYGWGDEQDKEVKGWTVFDLGEVRRWLFSYVMAYKKLPGQVQPVPYGGSLLALCMDDMPKAAIVQRNTILLGDPEDKKAIQIR